MEVQGKVDWVGTGSVLGLSAHSISFFSLEERKACKPSSGEIGLNVSLLEEKSRPDHSVLLQTVLPRHRQGNAFIVDRCSLVAVRDSR